MPFKKGEILCILNKDEDQWWTARNAQGLTGHIPVPYVQKVTPMTIVTIDRYQQLICSPTQQIEDDQKDRPHSGGSGGPTNSTSTTIHSTRSAQQQSESTLKRSNLNVSTQSILHCWL